MTQLKHANGLRNRNMRSWQECRVIPVGADLYIETDDEPGHWRVRHRGAPCLPGDPVGRNIDEARGLAHLWDAAGRDKARFASLVSGVRAMVEACRQMEAE